jgi:hypothetical protein
MDGMGRGGYDTGERDQLRDIAAAMQRQIELLASAVNELKEVRCLNSLLPYAVGVLRLWTGCLS